MTKAIHLFTAILALTLLAACGADENFEGDFGAIKVPDTRQLDQTVAADATRTPRDVVFVADGAWSSSIRETRAEAPDWIAISPDHGDEAGSYTLRIELQTNPFEEDRTATIAIVCGESKVEINVRQLATDNPIKPFNNRIARVEWRNTVTSNAPGSTPEEEWVATIDFRYDELGRVAYVTMDETPDNLANNMEQEIAFDYQSGTMQIRATDGQGTDLSYTLSLDAAGRAVEVRQEGGTEKWTFAYDKEGYCKQLRHDGIPSSMDIPKIDCVWSGGNLTSLNAFNSNGNHLSVYSHTFDYHAGTTNRPDAVNLDLNALLFNVCPDFEDGEFPMGAMLTVIGRLGRRSANLTGTNKDAHDYQVLPDGEMFTYYREADVTIEWTQQVDGSVTGATCTRKVEYVEEDRVSGKKTIVDGMGYTEADSYKIIY